MNNQNWTENFFLVKFGTFFYIRQQSWSVETTFIEGLSPCNFSSGQHLCPVFNSPIYETFYSV